MRLQHDISKRVFDIPIFFNKNFISNKILQLIFHSNFLYYTSFCSSSLCKHFVKSTIPNIIAFDGW